MRVRPFIIIAVVAIICGYSLYESRNLVLGPIIEVYEPSSGITVHSEVVTLKGIVKNTSEFIINGRPASIDHNGEFEEQFVLLDGYNTITIQAKDRFKRHTEHLIELIYERNQDQDVAKI